MKKLRAAVVGLGPAGFSHLCNCLIHPQVEVCAICCNDPAGFDGMRKDIGKYVEGGIAAGVGEYSDYGEMLRKESLDMVVIATPHEFHAPYAVAALDAGLHVLVEKPMATSIEDVSAMVAAVERSGRLLIVNQCVRFYPVYQEIRERLDSGLLGDIYYAESDCMHPLYDLETRHIHRSHHPYLLIGVHAFDLIRWMKCGRKVSEVFTYGTRMATHEIDFPFDDFIVSTFKFDDGAIGKSTTSIACHRPGYQGLALYGTKGSVIDDHPFYSPKIVMPESRQPLQPYAYHRFSSETPQQVCETLRITTSSKGVGHSFYHTLDDLVRAINGGGRPLVDVYEGANTMALCFAAIESHAKGAPVTPRHFARPA